MRIIKEKFFKEVVPPRTKSGKWLEAWRHVVRAAEWRNLGDLRKSYPSADTVRTKSGRNVTIFNVCGNDYRLIVSIHYDIQRIYTLRFLTHAECDKNDWKNES